MFVVIRNIDLEDVFGLRTGDPRRLRVADLGQERVVAEVAEPPLIVFDVRSRFARVTEVARGRSQRCRLGVEEAAEHVLATREPIAVERLAS
ncbi:MAG: hypothetical protein ACI85K_002476 [Hyphomicrobiaceae bacterium]|jgi:hypothetical protein